MSGKREKKIRRIRQINSKITNLQINLNDCPLYKCPKCEKEVFDRVEMIKVVSRLLTGRSFDTYVAKEMYRCVDCRYVLCSGSEPAPSARPA